MEDIEYEEENDDQQSFDTQHYSTWSRVIDRSWCPCLTVSEQAVLRFIFDQTAGEGRERMLTTLEQICCGVPASKGMVRGGAGVSTDTARAALSRLALYGCITRKQRRDGWECAINYEWRGGLTEVAKLRESKKRALSRERGVGNFIPLGYENSDPPDITIDHDDHGKINDHTVNITAGSKRIRPSRSDSSVRPPDAVQHDLAALADRVESANAQMRLDKVAAVKAAVLPVSKQSVRIWKLRCQHTYADHCAKARDLVKLAGYAKQYSKSGREDFITYMEWVVQNWRLIIAQNFNWLDTKPDVPSIPLFVRCSNKFEEAYRAKDRLTAAASMTERERLIAAAELKGMDTEAAERDADERLGITAERHRLEEERKELKRERIKLTQAKGHTARPAFEIISKPSPVRDSRPFGEWRED